ncbi:diguanylate cyclase [Yoonia sp. R2331]|uniref:diguanylate cyclase n=1 Tax=Yoonia sp. R2331 TaxID=3237238 RepID=UPI0034E5EFE3
MKIAKLLAEKSTNSVEKVSPTSTLSEVATKLMELRIGALVVCDAAGKLVGIVSERDLLPVVANIKALPANTVVAKVMSPNVITCGPDDEIAAILRLMNANSIRHIPVIVEQSLIDMVSIRELTTAYEILQKEADTDPLTELPNRRPFLGRLEAEFARAKRFKHHFAVAMIDIDHFKAVNDTYGHDAGDQVLRAVSGKLINQFRTIDMVGRLGGEEFAVIFPETKVKSAEIACIRLLQELESTIIFASGHQIGITASVGLAGLSSASTAGAEVLKRADELLYDAKRAGRNRVVSKAV